MAIFNTPQQFAFPNSLQLGFTNTLNRKIPYDLPLIIECETNPILSACVELNANTIAQAANRFHVYIPKQSTNQSLRTKKPNIRNREHLKTRIHSPSEEFLELIEHPLYSLLRNVNWSLVFGYYELIGRAYILVEKNEMTGIPDKLTVLKAYAVYPSFDDTGTEIVGYRYVDKPSLQYTAGQSISANPADDKFIISLRNPSLRDPWAFTKSPAMSAYNAGSASANLIDYLGTVMQNRGRPDSLIIPKEEKTEEQIAQMTKQFEDKFRGSGNGRVLIGDGTYNFIPLSFPPIDLAPVDVGQYVQNIAYNCFGIPIDLLSSGATYENREQARVFHAQTVVCTRLNLVENTLNQMLLPLFGDSQFLAFDNPVPEDNKQELLKLEKKKVDIQAATVPFAADILTINEYRELLGFEPIVGGDELLSTLKEIELQPEADELLSKEDDDDEQEEQEDLEELEATEEAAEPLDIVDLNTNVYNKQIDRATAINIVAFKLKITQREANKLITKKTKKAKKVQVVNEKNEVRIKRPTDVPVDYKAKLQPIIASAFRSWEHHYLSQITPKMLRTNVKAELPDSFVPVDRIAEEQLAHECQPIVELFANNAGHELWGRVGASPDAFSVVPAKIKEAMKKSTLKFCQETNQTTSIELNQALKILRKSIEDGLVEGDPVDALTKRVKEIFDEAEKFRAERIARTEASRAIHTGQQIAAKESGLVKGWKYLASDNCCDICRDLDGKEIGLNDNFFDDDYGNGLVPVHPNCTCTMLEIIKEKGE